MRRRLLLAAAAALGILLAGGAAFYLLQGGSEFPSPSCRALSLGWSDIPRQQGGFTYMCGLGSVSDGRIDLTLNNYRFADGSTIEWQCSGALNGSSGCSSSGVYLLANVTLTNIGEGDAPIGPDLYVNVSDTGSPSLHIGNGEYGADAIFPGQYPNRSIPAVSGGTYLPSKAGATYWFIFYIPNVVIGDALNLKLHTISFAEFGYGGTWDGSGFTCVPVACQEPMTELVVVAS